VKSASITFVQATLSISALKLWIFLLTVQFVFKWNCKTVCWNCSILLFH